MPWRSQKCIKPLKMRRTLYPSATLNANPCYEPTMDLTSIEDDNHLIRIRLLTSDPDPTLYEIMVLILDGNSEHVARVSRKLGL